MQAFATLAFILTIAATRGEAAESTTATISGIVRSTQGGAVADARVAAVSPSGRYDARTDARGAFRLLGVVPDTYTISIEARGFDTAVQSGITALPAGAPSLAVRLTPALATIGSVRSSVTPIAIGSTVERFVITGTAAGSTLTSRA